jgi:hypothetical protein
MMLHQWQGREVHQQRYNDLLQEAQKRRRVNGASADPGSPLAGTLSRVGGILSRVGGILSRVGGILITAGRSLEAQNPSSIACQTQK